MDELKTKAQQACLRSNHRSPPPFFCKSLGQLPATANSFFIQVVTLASYKYQASQLPQPKLPRCLAHDFLLKAVTCFAYHLANFLTRHVELIRNVSSCFCSKIMSNITEGTSCGQFSPLLYPRAHIQYSAHGIPWPTPLPLPNLLFPIMHMHPVRNAFSSVGRA